MVERTQKKLRYSHLGSTLAGWQHDLSCFEGHQPVLIYKASERGNQCGGRAGREVEETMFGVRKPVFS